jgi:hypothetical protein
MSRKFTLELIEKELVEIQDKLHNLDKKGCEACGYFDSEAMEAHNIEQEYFAKIREYEEVLSILGEPDG